MNQQAQTGETLIEVLVAIALVAFSLLGIARLALSASQAQQDGLFKVRTNAIFGDLNGRISANRSQADVNFTSVGQGYNFSSKWSDQASAAPTPAVNCNTSACTASQRSAFDIFEIRTSTRKLLPKDH